MRNITKTVYFFNELQDKAKQKALDTEREKQYFQDSADCVIQDAKEVAALFGLDIEDVFYYGFYSQGSGACFTGEFKPNDNSVYKVKQHCPSDVVLHKIVQDLEDSVLLFDLYSDRPLHGFITKIGSYCHEESISFDFDDTDRTDNPEIEVHLGEIKDALKRFAQWIYSNLQSEYDFQTSDEALSEMLISNEVEFYEDGSAL